MSDRRDDHDPFGFGLKRDTYEVPVQGVSADNLQPMMRKSLDAVTRLWPPDTSVALFISDFGYGGGLAYISNAERAGMIATVREWLERQEKLA